MTAYARRKRFENRALAVALINTIGELFGKSGDNRIPPELMLAMMGGQF